MKALSHLFSVILAASAALGLPAMPAGAGEPVAAIGIVAPLSGPFAPLGQQLRDGALDAIAAASIELRPVIADDRCSAEGGAAAGELLAGQAVVAVIGFLCGEAIEAAMPALADAAIPVLTPGVRATALTDQQSRTGWPVFRLAPRADHEAEAIGTILVRHWAEEHFAIVDDGTVYSRNLADALRLAAEEAGLQPVFVDSYRPQSADQIALARRLQRAGATHAFVGGDRYDLAILARDAAALGNPLALAGGEALRASAGEPDLAAGTLMVGLPEEVTGGAGYAAAAAAAISIVEQALRDGHADRPSIERQLRQNRFETNLGPVAFDGKGDRIGNPFRLFRYDGKNFSEVTP